MGLARLVYLFKYWEETLKTRVTTAENEAEVQDWMRRLEEAKLQLTSSENPINSPTKTSMMQLDMEDDDGEELTLKEPIFEDHASSTLHATEE